MTEREQKYNAFAENDRMHNAGRLLNGCEELKFLLDNPQANQVFARHYENDILTYAAKLSPYYRQLLTNRGGYSLRDFPIMTKADLKAHWDEIAIPEFAADASICTKFTSGSTGTPFKMILDKYKHTRWIAGNKVFRENVGVLSHEKTFFVSGTVRDKQIPKERMDRDNVYYILMPYIDDAVLTKLVTDMLQQQVKTLTAMASIYDKLARAIRQGNIPEWQGELIACFSVSEPLKESTRKIISDYFHCPVYVFYANEENGVLGVEDGSPFGCRANNVDYTLEVLKMDSDEPAEDGEIGRLVITDYFNKAFPIIRYENGDLVSVKHLPDGRMYITEILGRVVDTLYTTDGRMVHYFDGISFMEEFLDIQQFQLIQEDYHHFTWVLNTTNHQYEPIIVDYCKKLFGEDSEWQFEYVNEIPKLQSGKSRMTVCRIADKIKKPNE